MKIDFVITWVDSSDLVWLTKKNKELKLIGKPMEDANGIERFRDYGTLKYLLRSIEKYASWVNKIYLVTDNQKPSWLKESLQGTKLQIIDHKEIIPKKARPTFNSNAIEMCIDAIPNLSEHFVIFNDDCLINKETSPQDFFDDDGTPKDFRLYSAFSVASAYDQLRFNDNFALNNMVQKNGKWPLSKKGLFSLKYPLRSNIRNLYFKVDSHGRISTHVIPHNALSFTKSNFEKAKKQWVNEVNTTIMQKFRSKQDITIFLLRGFQLENGSFSVRSPEFSKYFVLNQTEDIAKELKRQQHSLLCINDTNTPNYEHETKIIQAALEEKFIEKSQFEK